MTDTVGVLVVKDGNTPSQSRNLGGTADAGGTFYPAHNLRFDGVDAGAAAPFPMVDAAGNAILTAIQTSTAAGATATGQATGNTSLAAIAASVAAAPTATGQASALTQATATATGVGTPADTAWVSGAGSIVAVLKGIFGKLGSVVITAGSAVIGTVIPRAPLNLTMTVVTIPAGISTFTIGSNPARKSIQLLNIGTGFATARTFPVAGTGGTVPTAAGQASATSNAVAINVGYPLEAASAVGHQGGSTPIYDGTGLCVDEWDVISTAGTTILVIEGN